MNNDLAAVLTIRLVGAVAGTILAIALTPPRTLRGCIQRVVVGLCSGVVFAGQVHAYSGSAFSDDVDGLICAAAVTAFVSWQLLTALKSAVAAWLLKRGGDRAGQED